MADVCCPDDDEPKRTGETREVKQVSYFSGRSRTVVVEVKRRRVVVGRKRTPEAGESV